MVARIVVFLCLLGAVAAVNNTFVTPMNCSDDKASCNSYYMYTQGGTATDVANLYGVPPASVTNITGGQSFAVKLPCQCAYLPADYDSSNKSGALVYSSQINYTPSVQDLSYSSIVSKFENAVVIPDNLRAVNFTPGTPQVLYLGCGCLPTQYTAPPYEYKSVVTYRIKPGDILFALSSTFEDNRTAIKDLNHLPSEDVIVANRVLFIPIKSGEWPAPEVVAIIDCTWRRLPQVCASGARLFPFCLRTAIMECACVRVSGYMSVCFLSWLIFVSLVVCGYVQPRWMWLVFTVDRINGTVPGEMRLPLPLQYSPSFSYL